MKHPHVKKLIEENLDAKNPVLDLGNCGLDGTEPELDALAECAHLKTLIFSNEWVAWNAEEQHYEEQKSNRREILVSFGARRPLLP